MLLAKIAWRNLFRQRRRTAITASAMALSLIVAIPTYGLMEGLGNEMLRGITGMDLGHIQVHDPSYPRGRALQSTLRQPDRLLRKIRGTSGVVAAAPRVHGYALASHDVTLLIELLPLADAPVIRFGRAIARQAAWRADPALECEGLVPLEQATARAVTVGTVLTPAAATPGERCERIRVVGLLGPPSKPSNPPTPYPAGSSASPLSVFMPVEDIQTAFGSRTRRDRATLMHSAPIALEGIEPAYERHVSFMADKITEGRYLRADAGGEVVVGYRLAQVLRLRPGDKLFIQAGSLDYSSNTYYQDFVVAGIYRTGVDTVDRSRVFLHLADAQRLMALEQRIHEIVVVGQDARHPSALARQIGTELRRSPLLVSTQSTGLRAGSAPLAAPLTIYEPQVTSSGAALLIPYDLRQRFDDLPGVRALARRAYAQSNVATSPTVAPATDTGVTLRLVGVEADLERQLSQLDKKLSRASHYLPLDGSAFDDGSWPALLSERVASSMHLTLTDRLLLRCRDEDGGQRWQSIRVVGLLSNQQWSEARPQLILPYFLAQQVDSPRLNAHAQEILPVLRSGANVEEVAREARVRLAPLVRTWQQIAPDMAKLLQTQDAWMGVMLLVIFGIAALTVMNTMLMAVFERTKEFGVMKSIGMRPWQVFALITIETLALATMAITLGGAVGAALNHYLMTHGLDLSAYTGGFTYQGTFIDPVWRSVVSVKNTATPMIMVAVVCLLVSFYPALRAGRLRPVEALRDQV